MNTVNYKMNKATLAEIENHLTECSEQFIPILSSYVDLHIYSSKIANNATTFEAWCENYLVGLVAIYYNVEAKNVFITNVSVVSSYQGKSIAGKLLDICFNLSRDLLYTNVSLDVNKLNIKAISFYKRKGFCVVKSIDNISSLLRMNLSLLNKE